jgi:hypothetical protein
MRFLRFFGYLLLAGVLTSCGGSSENRETEPKAEAGSGSASEYLSSGLPHKSLTTRGTPNALYLDERLDDSPSIEALHSEEWNHVIFQAQKYSQSGIVGYPTNAAKVWITRAKQINATPILFPEHPQKGDIDEIFEFISCINQFLPMNPLV